MELSPELKKAVDFNPLEGEEKKKRKKRLKLGYFLIIFFLILGAPAFIRNFSLADINLFFFGEKKEIVKPFSEIDKKFTLWEELRRFGFKVKRIKEIGANDYEVDLEEGIKVYFKKNDFKEQITSLQFIIDRFRIEGRKVKKVDLRFKNPIIE